MPTATGHEQYEHVHVELIGIGICQKDSNGMLRLKTKYLQSTISTFA